MSKIVEISKIQTSLYLFGYIGKDLETGEIKYYKKNQNKLQKLDEVSFDNLNWYNLHTYCVLKESHSFRTKYSSVLPDELVGLVPEIIDQHMQFNQENCYPTSSFELSRAHLVVETKDGSRSQNTMLPVEDYFANKIRVGVTKFDWNRLTNEEKEREKNYLIHELGHLKATQCFMAGDILHVQVGFDSYYYKVKPIPLDNGDVFYQIEYSLCKENPLETYILEELANDLDCRGAFSTFLGKHMEFCDELNDLFDGNLLSMRYGGIEEFFKKMFQLIPNKDFAIKLLGNIYHFNTFWDEKSYDGAKRLIKEYEGAKK